MTPLKKAVTRRSEELYRDRSKFRRIVVTLYPAGSSACGSKSAPKKPFRSARLTRPPCRRA